MIGDSSLRDQVLENGKKAKEHIGLYSTEASVKGLLAAIGLQ